MKRYTPEQLVEDFPFATVATLATWRSRGGGPPYVKANRRILYRQEDVEQWLADQVRHSTAPTAAERASRATVATDQVTV